MKNRLSLFYFGENLITLIIAIDKYKIKIINFNLLFYFDYLDNIFIM